MVKSKLLLILLVLIFEKWNLLSACYLSPKVKDLEKILKYNTDDGSYTCQTKCYPDRQRNRCAMSAYWIMLEHQLKEDISKLQFNGVSLEYSLRLQSILVELFNKRKQAIENLIETTSQKYKEIFQKILVDELKSGRLSNRIAYQIGLIFDDVTPVTPTTLDIEIYKHNYVDINNLENIQIGLERSFSGHLVEDTTKTPKTPKTQLITNTFTNQIKIGEHYYDDLHPHVNMDLMKERTNSNEMLPELMYHAPTPAACTTTTKTTTTTTPEPKFYKIHSTSYPHILKTLNNSNIINPQEHDSYKEIQVFPNMPSKHREVEITTEMYFQAELGKLLGIVEKHPDLKKIPSIQQRIDYYYQALEALKKNSNPTIVNHTPIDEKVSVDESQFDSNAGKKMRHNTLTMSEMKINNPGDMKRFNEYSMYSDYTETSEYDLFPKYKDMRNRGHQGMRGDNSYKLQSFPDMIEDENYKLNFQSGTIPNQITQLKPKDPLKVEKTTPMNAKGAIEYDQQSMLTKTNKYKNQIDLNQNRDQMDYFVEGHASYENDYNEDDKFKTMFKDQMGLTKEMPISTKVQKTIEHQDTTEWSNVHDVKDNYQDGIYKRLKGQINYPINPMQEKTINGEYDYNLHPLPNNLNIFNKYVQKNISPQIHEKVYKYDYQYPDNFWYNSRGEQITKNENDLKNSKQEVLNRKFGYSIEYLPSMFMRTFNNVHIPDLKNQLKEKGSTSEDAQNQQFTEFMAKHKVISSYQDKQPIPNIELNRYVETVSKNLEPNHHELLRKMSNLDKLKDDNINFDKFDKLNDIGAQGHFEITEPFDYMARHASKTSDVAEIPSTDHIKNSELSIKNQMGKLGGYNTLHDTLGNTKKGHQEENTVIQQPEIYKGLNNIQISHNDRIGDTIMGYETAGVPQSIGNHQISAPKDQLDHSKMYGKFDKIQNSADLGYDRQEQLKIFVEGKPSTLTQFKMPEMARVAEPHNMNVETAFGGQMKHSDGDMQTHRSGQPGFNTFSQHGVHSIIPKNQDEQIMPTGKQYKLETSGSGDFNTGAVLEKGLHLMPITNEGGFESYGSTQFAGNIPETVQSSYLHSNFQPNVDMTGNLEKHKGSHGGAVSSQFEMHKPIGLSTGFSAQVYGHNKNPFNQFELDRRTENFDVHDGTSKDEKKHGKNSNIYGMSSASSGQYREISGGSDVDGSISGKFNIPSAIHTGLDSIATNFGQFMRGGFGGQFDVNGQVRGNIENDKNANDIVVHGQFGEPVGYRVKYYGHTGEQGQPMGNADVGFGQYSDGTISNGPQLFKTQISVKGSGLKESDGPFPQLNQFLLGKYNSKIFK